MDQYNMLKHTNYTFKVGLPYAKNSTRSWQQTMFRDNYDSDGNARFHGQRDNMNVLMY